MILFQFLCLFLSYFMYIFLNIFHAWQNNETHTRWYFDSTYKFEFHVGCIRVYTYKNTHTHTHTSTHHDVMMRHHQSYNNISLCYATDDAHHKMSEPSDICKNENTNKKLLVSAKLYVRIKFLKFGDETATLLLESTIWRYRYILPWFLSKTC